MQHGQPIELAPYPVPLLEPGLVRLAQLLGSGLALLLRRVEPARELGQRAVELGRAGSGGVVARERGLVDRVEPPLELRECACELASS